MPIVTEDDLKKEKELSEFMKKYYNEYWNNLNNPNKTGLTLSVDSDIFNYLIDRIEREKNNKIFIGVVKGIRFDAWDKSESERDIIYFIKKGYDERHWVYLLNGVTGYESIAVERIKEPCIEGCKGWIACMGTDRRWDKLIIPHEEMDKVREHIKELGVS